MGELFSVLAESLPAQGISPGQAISIIDVLEESLGALRAACAGETWSDPTRRIMTAFRRRARRMAHSCWETRLRP